MKFEKARWSADGDKLSLSVGLNKVDRENRFVYGFASLDNVDTQGDRILPEANKSAFSRFRGNLREMHDAIAAGRVVDFREQEFADENGKTYKGIFVKAYVSKGAPLTWEKVLDGTLTGFSIGGNIVDSEPVFDKASGSSVRIIKDYDLVELSLVDNPANQLANIFSVEKSSEGSFIKMASDITTTQVFWCDTDEIAKEASDNAAPTCPGCVTEMKSIGWYETTEKTNASEELAKVISKYKGTSAPESNEGGVSHMGSNIKKDNEVITTETVEGDEPVNPTEEVKSDEEVATDGENPEEVVKTDEEAATDEPNLEKMFDGLKNALMEEIHKGNQISEESLTKVNTQMDELRKASDERFAEFDRQFQELSQTNEAIKSQVAEMEKSVSTLDKAAATKKSGEVEITKAATQNEKKSTFSGVFL